MNPSDVTESEYIEELKKRWPRTGEGTKETIAFADEATRAFPRSPKLWCMRGNLVELGLGNSPYSVEDAIASYKRAIEFDPQFIQAWEDIGYLYRNVLKEEDKAKSYLHEAERLKGYYNSIPGRAVLRR